MNQIIREDLEYIYKNNIIDWGRFKNKHVLITGAYGMLASYMVYMLIYLNEINPSLNIKISAVCRDRQKALRRFESYSHKPYFNIIEADICNKFDIGVKVDFIIHAASPASSQYYGINPIGVLTPNLIGTYNTLELAKLNNVEGYLYFSSSEIYGKLDIAEINETDSGYLNVLDVRSCYAESKRMGENMCKCWQHQYGIPVKIIRPSHTYGPTMDLINDSRVFAEFVSNVVNGQDIIMKSDGSSRRTFCYIADATLGYFKVLLDGIDGEAYNVSNSDCNVSIKELANIIVNLFPEKKLKTIFQERPKDAQYLENSSNIMHPILNTDKLKSLGWKCNYDVHDGFLRTIRSFN